MIGKHLKNNIQLVRYAIAIVARSNIDACHIDEADVIRFVNEINKANETGRGVQLVGTSFMLVTPLKYCEDGPEPVVHQVDPNVFISPVPLKYTCNGLPCQGPECSARSKGEVCQWGMHYTIRICEGLLYQCL